MEAAAVGSASPDRVRMVRRMLLDKVGNSADCGSCR